MARTHREKICRKDKTRRCTVAETRRRPNHHLGDAVFADGQCRHQTFKPNRRPRSEAGTVRASAETVRVVDTGSSSHVTKASSMFVLPLLTTSFPPVCGGDATRWTRRSTASSSPRGECHAPSSTRIAPLARRYRVARRVDRAIASRRVVCTRHRLARRVGARLDRDARRHMTTLRLLIHRHTVTTSHRPSGFPTNGGFI